MTNIGERWKTCGGFLRAAKREARLSDQIPPQDWQQLQRELAKIRYERHLHGAIDRSRAVIDFALLGLRGLTIINGGALIGLVTFLGHVESARHAQAVPLWWAYALFVFGLFLSFIAILGSYLAQTYFNWNEMSEAERAGLQALGRDYGEDDGKNSRQQWEDGNKARTVAIVCAIGSILAFCIGAFCALAALVSTATAQ